MNQEKPKSQDLISIVITTKNEEKNIQNCLDSLAKQSYKNFEIILVDNNSSDKTVQITKQYTDKIYTFGPERSAQRNLGMKNAEGKYILFLDADMILSEHVLKDCIDLFVKNPFISGLYIPEIIIGKGFWIAVRAFERSFYNGTPIDCVRFFPVDSFIHTKGFDENFSGPEDWDFDKKIRQIGQTQVSHAPLYHNEGDFNLSKYLKKKAYYSKSMEAYVNRWGRNDPDIKKQLGLYYRYLGVFIEKGKYKKLLQKPVLTFGMYFLRFLVGLVFLKTKLFK